MRSFIRLDILADDESVASSGGEDVSEDQLLSDEESSHASDSDDDPLDDGELDFDLFADIVAELDATPQAVSTAPVLEPPDSLNRQDDDDSQLLPENTGDTGEEHESLLPFEDEELLPFQDEDDDLLPSPGLLQGHDKAAGPAPQPEAQSPGAALGDPVGESQQSVDAGPDVDGEDDPSQGGDTPQAKGADPAVDRSTEANGEPPPQRSQPLDVALPPQPSSPSSSRSSLTPAPTSPARGSPTSSARGSPSLSPAPPSPKTATSGTLPVVAPTANGDPQEARDASPAPGALAEADSTTNPPENAQAVDFDDGLPDTEPVTTDLEPAAEVEPVTDTVQPPTPQHAPRRPGRQNQRAFLNRSYKRAEELTAFGPDSEEDELQEAPEVSKHASTTRRITGPRPSIQRRPRTPEPAPPSVSSLRVKPSPRSPDLLLPYNPRKSLPVSPLKQARPASTSHRASSHHAASTRQPQSSSRAPASHRASSSHRAPSPPPRRAVSPLAERDLPADIPPPQIPRLSDSLMVDWDGKPLETDESYVLPADYDPNPSRLHGQVNGRGFRYARKSGKRRWTGAEELTLYRTLQKVPMSETYPLRVVWYLHGEWGVHSRVLSEFNPQHMKDKMRTIINRRINQRLPIEGRARAFLPASDPRRDDFDAEMEQYNELMADMQYQEELEAVKEEEISEEEDDEDEGGDVEEGGDRYSDNQDDGQNDIGVYGDELDSDASDEAYLDALVATDSEQEEPPRRVQPTWAVDRSPPRRRRQLTVEIPVKRRLPGPPAPVPRVSPPGPSRRAARGPRSAPAPPPPPPPPLSDSEPEADIDHTVLAVATDSQSIGRASTEPAEASEDEDVLPEASDDEDEYFSLPTLSPLPRTRALPSSTPPAAIPVRLPRQPTRSSSRSASPPARRETRSRGGTDAGRVLRSTDRALRSTDHNVQPRSRHSNGKRRSLRPSDANVRYREASDGASDDEGGVVLKSSQASQDEVPLKRGRGRPRGSKTRRPVEDVVIVEEDSDGAARRTTRARARASGVGAGTGGEVVAVSVESDSEPVTVEPSDSDPPFVADEDDSDSDSSIPLSAARAGKLSTAEAEAEAEPPATADSDDDVPLARIRKRKAALFLPGPDSDDEEEGRRAVLRRKVMGL
ncbi:hypothetical protein Q8F55_002787 [Vanrija albida]|uniref:Transcription factor TFIIIB component B'' Myb domain-containing protein n=1 Tax=Vanrija albida TaxID=181172 RepID=A0ABR3QAT7_9TREE